VIWPRRRQSAEGHAPPAVGGHRSGEARHSAGFRAGLAEPILDQRIAGEQIAAPIGEQQTQIAYTMAATTRTPAVSIKISAISKPAIRAFDMGTSPPDLYAALHFGAAINQFEIRPRGSRNRAQSRRRPQTLQTHEMQRPKKCARAGSATRLNAGSHPTGGRALTAMAGNETVEVRFSSNRSPLFVRLTETVCCAVLATPGVLTTAGNAPANRPTSTTPRVAQPSSPTKENLSI
jgi:hypothetical protein